MIVLYKVYVGGCADETGKIPISVPDFRGELRDLKCGAGSDESLIMYFQDKFWAGKDTYCLGNMSGVDDWIKSKLEEILNMDEDKRAKEHLAFEDPHRSRRPRNYVLYENGKPL